MIEHLVASIRELVSPSMRFRLRESAAWIREQLDWACFWRWEITNLTQNLDDGSRNIVYLGRKSRRDLAKALLNAKDNDRLVKLCKASQTAIVSDVPIPGAFRIPGYLRVTIPLGRSIEAITEGFDDNFRRILRQNLTTYSTQQTQDNAAISRAIEAMLQPYANARHGSAAAQLAPETVQKIAHKSGRLDLVLMGDEVVACALACEITQAGKRYWSLIRCGYPDAVFSNSKRLSETNVINFFFALDWAIKHDFDYYDMGTCLARPEDGSLQWKKRWGGLVDTACNHKYLYVRLPKVGAAKFLWDVPLFAVEHNKLTLHLGLPDESSDEEFLIRHRGMGIGGLFRISIHCARPPNETLCEKLLGLFNPRLPPPSVEFISSQ